MKHFATDIVTETNEYNKFIAFFTHFKSPQTMLQLSNYDFGFTTGHAHVNYLNPKSFT